MLNLPTTMYLFGFCVKPFKILNFILNVFSWHILKFSSINNTLSCFVTRWDMYLMTLFTIYYLLELALFGVQIRWKTVGNKWKQRKWLWWIKIPLVCTLLEALLFLTHLCCIVHLNVIRFKSISIFIYCTLVE